MANAVSPELLGDAIQQQLTIYSEAVTQAIDKASLKAVKEITELTQLTAPVGARWKFRRSIAYKLLESTPRGKKYVWYVKSPEHRLTHLLVHGHATKNGGRTSGNPFLSDAVQDVIPDYLKQVEEAIQNGGR